MRLQSICLIFCFLINISFLMGQHAQTQLSAPKKLDSLLKKKIALDRLNTAKRQYTIQVFYGSFEATTSEMERFKALFPDMTAHLIFETPNYKIRTGNYTTEREASAELEKVKRRFRSAFVLKP